MTLRLDTLTASPPMIVWTTLLSTRECILIPRTYSTENFCNNTHFFSIDMFFASCFPNFPNGDVSSLLLHGIYSTIMRNNILKMTLFNTGN